MLEDTPEPIQDYTTEVVVLDKGVTHAGGGLVNASGDDMLRWSRGLQELSEKRRALEAYKEQDSR